MNNLHTCNVCLKECENISFCVICLESGKICHECVRKWKSVGNNPNKCIICKKIGIENLPFDLIISEDNISNTVHLNTNYTIRRQRIASEFTSTNNEENISLNLKIRKILHWVIIMLVLSWSFATFSYFIVFNLKSKHLWSKFYITIGCGSIFGLPVTFIFRNWIRENCIPNE